MTQTNRDTDFDVLRLLEQSPDLSQREIADRLKISVGGVNYCLKALVAKGLVKMQNFRKSDNRMAYSYTLTPKGLSEKMQLTRHFLRRKLREYEAIQEEILQLEKELAAGTAASAAPCDDQTEAV